MCGPIISGHCCQSYCNLSKISEQLIYTFPCPVMLRNFTCDVTINWGKLGDKIDIYPTLLVAKLVTKVGFMIELNPSFDGRALAFSTPMEKVSLAKLPHDTIF